MSRRLGWGTAPGGFPGPTSPARIVAIVHPSSRAIPGFVSTINGFGAAASVGGGYRERHRADPTGIPMTFPAARSKKTSPSRAAAANTQACVESAVKRARLQWFSADRSAFSKAGQDGTGISPAVSNTPARPHAVPA